MIHPDSHGEITFFASIDNGEQFALDGGEFFLDFKVGILDAIRALVKDEQAGIDANLVHIFCDFHRDIAALMMHIGNKRNIHVLRF